MPTALAMMLAACGPASTVPSATSAAAAPTGVTGAPSAPLAPVQYTAGFNPAAIAATRPKAWSGAGGTVEQQLERLLPAGATLEPVPGAGSALYLTEPLTGPGAKDVVALYAAGTRYVGYGIRCSGVGRTGYTQHRGCHFLVAAPTPQDGLTVLWWLPAAGLWTPAPQFVNFVGSGPVQLFVDLPEGASGGDFATVVSFAGGTAHVLFDPGGAVQLLQSEQPGGLPALAAWTHFTGPAGGWAIWRWDPAMRAFERADGAFPAFFKQLEQHLSLTPQGAAWVDYYAALVYLMAGDDQKAVSLAQQGINGVGAMHGDPGFYEIEGTVDRREGKCSAAVPLYQKVTSSPQPGLLGGISWPARPRAWYGLALCAKQGGNLAQMRADLQQALSVGRPCPYSIRTCATTSSDPTSWDGYAQAKKLLAG